MKRENPPEGTLILGLGNPILGDDGVGCRVAELIGERLVGVPGLTAISASVSPVRLVDMITRFQSLIIIDSVTTGKAEPGELLEIDYRNRDYSPPSAHHFSVHQIPEIAGALGLPCPGVIKVYGIEIIPATEYCAVFSTGLQGKIPGLVDELIKKIEEFTGNKPVRAPEGDSFI